MGEVKSAQKLSGPPGQSLTCMSPRRVWHLCNLPCVYVLFRLISIQRYAFKSPQICFWGTKYEFYREHVANLHYIVRQARLWSELFVSTLSRPLPDVTFVLERFSSEAKPVAWSSFTSGKLYICLQAFLDSLDLVIYLHNLINYCDITEHDLCQFFLDVPSLQFFLGRWVWLLVGYFLFFFFCL